MNNVPPSIDSSTIKTTIGGTALSIFATIDTQDIVKTVVMATIGALVSFLVSKAAQWLWRKIRK